jgi:hypothetical protein
MVDWDSRTYLNWHLNDWYWHHRRHGRCRVLSWVPVAFLDAADWIISNEVGKIKK